MTFFIKRRTKANFSLSTTTNKKTIKYVYDGAGRLVKEGDKVYSYGWPDKIVNVQENNRRN